MKKIIGLILLLAMLMNVSALADEFTIHSIVHSFHSFHLYVKMMMNCMNNAARKSFRQRFSGE